MFSSRVPPSLEANALSRALREARAASRPLIDLTITNPTQAGFAYPESLLAALGSTAALVYEPSPLGLQSARDAVARDYSRRAIIVPAERIILTSSTSEAYSLLFKLLCAPAGDAVLTPSPSYPLFEHLTTLDGVSPVPYRLEYEGRWTLDRSSVESAWTERTRAVLAVSPNNPTGSCFSRDEFDWLSEICASRGAALILDEVFADYPLSQPDSRAPGPPDIFFQGSRGPTPARSRSAAARLARAAGAAPEPPNSRTPGCLTFRLGGLSKSAGLPQVKLGWIAVEGPDVLVAEAVQRLEFICDAYLSVSTPIQLAAPALIDGGQDVRGQIAERVRSNYGRLLHLAAGHPSVEVLRADAGWSAVVRVPSRRSEEELVLELLEREDVVVHPGFFFDFDREAFLVVSLLPPAPLFEEGVSRVLHRVH